jgi:hypothetical protein
VPAGPGNCGTPAQLQALFGDQLLPTKFMQLEQALLTLSGLVCCHIIKGFQAMSNKAFTVQVTWRDALEFHE